jgi:hypothetical protein
MLLAVEDRCPNLDNFPADLVYRMSPRRNLVQLSVRSYRGKLAPRPAAHFHTESIGRKGRQGLRGVKGSGA